MQDEIPTTIIAVNLFGDQKPNAQPQTTTCEVCDGSGQVDPMLSATDPANGPCEACGGKGAVSQTTDLTDACLRIFHGNGAHGWRLLKQQWPDVAVREQRRKMGAVIREVQSISVSPSIGRLEAEIVILRSELLTALAEVKRLDAVIARYRESTTNG